MGVPTVTPIVRYVQTMTAVNRRDFTSRCGAETSATPTPRARLLSRVVM